MKDRRRSCELCNNHATLYCASDSAFLCLNCDSRVHGANFLVARHLRHPLCSQCNSLAAHPIAGDAINIPNYKSCSSCSPENDDDENDTLSISSSFDSAYSSACVPSTESSATTTKQQRSESSSVTRLSGRATSSFAKKKVAGDTRFEGTFVNWCEKMGMSGGNLAAMSAAASHALGFCMGRLAGVPLRVSLAASFWFGVRMTSSSLGSTCQNLRRVEMMSGVPARMFLAVEAKLRRELMRVRRGTRPAAELEEGWAEC